MNVLFLIPPSDLTGRRVVVDRLFGCNYGYDYKPAIHLLTSATVMASKGDSVRFMDCPAEGIDLRAWKERIGREKFDVVVFFTTWLSAEIDLGAAQMMVERQKNIRVVFMGAYPTWKPELFLRNNGHFVIRGEAEATLVELISSFETSSLPLNTIKGVSFLENGKIVHNQRRDLLDLDTLPVPDRRLLKGRYFLNKVEGYPATVMCVSRGCSYGCTYCAPHALDQSIELECVRHGLEKPRLRLRSVQNVIAEFQAIAAAGFQGIDIADNQFVWGRERTIRICEGIKPLKLQWVCYARADHLKDKEMLVLMKEAGCRLIYIGTESFDQRILDDVHKQCTVQDYVDAVERVRSAGIEPEVSVLIGASGLETRETVLRSMREARKMKTRFVHCSIAMPLPNTALYKIAKEKGWIKAGDFVPVDNVRDGIMDLPSLKAVEMKILLKGFYRTQYLSAGFVVKQVSRIRSWHVFVQKMKAFSLFVYGLIRVSR